MMTVMFRGRKPRRYINRSLTISDWPRSWSESPSAWPATAAPGSAKPGRGGRRKRKREQAAQRQAQIFLTSSSMHMSRLLDRWSEQAGKAWPFVTLPRLGRRERRRRAKLRRRRARAEAEGRRPVLVNPLYWCGPTMAALACREIARTIAEETSLEHATGPALDRLAEMYGMKRIPGA